jgi:4-hydroxy-3-methylbut-2-enyl diphosphate reductase
LEMLRPRDGVQAVRATDEDEYFPPPRHIRELRSGMETVVTIMSGGSVTKAPMYDDHSLSASAVLAALAN